MNKLGLKQTLLLQLKPTHCVQDGLAADHPRATKPTTWFLEVQSLSSARMSSLVSITLVSEEQVHSSPGYYRSPLGAPSRKTCSVISRTGPFGCAARDVSRTATVLEAERRPQSLISGLVAHVNHEVPFCRPTDCVLGHSYAERCSGSAPLEVSLRTWSLCRIWVHKAAD